jgi:hypothetical protein
MSQSNAYSDGWPETSGTSEAAAGKNQGTVIITGDKACWVLFAGWIFMQPPAPSGGIAFYHWPVWARVTWGVLTAIALGHFVHFLA